MYLKFNKDVTFNGKSYKAGSVYYVSNHKRFTKDGSATEVNYEEHHETVKNNVIDAPKDGK